MYKILSKSSCNYYLNLIYKNNNIFILNNMRSNVKKFLKIYAFSQTKLVPKKNYLPPES